MEKGSHVGQARGDVEAQATLVRCLARQRALALFEGMRSPGPQANVITYNATISACEKGAGKGSVAWRYSRRCTCWAAGLR